MHGQHIITSVSENIFFLFVAFSPDFDSHWWVQNIPDIPVVVPIGRPPMYICIIFKCSYNYHNLVLAIASGSRKAIVAGPSSPGTYTVDVPLVHLQHFVILEAI